MCACVRACVGKMGVPLDFKPLQFAEIWRWELTVKGKNTTEEAQRVLLATQALDDFRLDEEGCERVNTKTNDTPPATVHNIVSTSIVHGNDMPINLQRLSIFLPCSSYNRRRFAAITIRVHNPHFTALLFTSGKLVVTGLKSWYECMLASLSMSRIINSTLVNTHFQIMNCEVSSANPFF